MKTIVTHTHYVCNYIFGILCRKQTKMRIEVEPFEKSLLWIPGLGLCYYLFGYVALNCISTKIQIPYETLASEMTDSYEVRSKVNGITMICQKAQI